MGFLKNPLDLLARRDLVDSQLYGPQLRPYRTGEVWQRGRNGLPTNARPNFSHLSEVTLPMATTEVFRLTRFRQAWIFGAVISTDASRIIYLGIEMAEFSKSQPIQEDDLLYGGHITNEPVYHPMPPKLLIRGQRIMAFARAAGATWDFHWSMYVPGLSN